jgi:F-type H+-transporting ATPase subunit delta
MSDAITIARPYAKAIFQHALAKQELAAWSQALQDLALIIVDAAAFEFISNPNVTVADQVQFLLETTSRMSQAVDKSSVQHLIELLLENKRLLVLPEIFVQYEALRAEQEKTLSAVVVSFSELSHKEQIDLSSVLSKRLGRQVTLEVKLDKSLLGGAIILAGDLVIDGSVRGKLNKISTCLSA